MFVRLLVFARAKVIVEEGGVWRVEGCSGKGGMLVWDGFFIARVNITSINCVATVTPRCKQIFLLPGLPWQSLKVRRKAWRLFY